MQLDFDEVRGQYEVVEAGRRRPAEPNLVINAKDALAPFLDKWVPVPFLQVRPNNQHREGPADWARVRVVDLEARYGEGFRDEQGHRFRAVLAFDTGLIAEAEGRAYLAPSGKDVTSGALFALAPQQRANHWLLRQSWMNQWLEELFREIHPRATLEEIDSDIKQKPQEASARYLAFLGLLANVAHFPPVKLVGDAERPGRGAIEVDLVLDVGNSRTCGILIEASRRAGRRLNKTATSSSCATSRVPRCVLHRAVREPRRVRPGELRQGRPVAPRRARATPSSGRRSARVGPEAHAARRAAPRHRGQHRHVEPQALPVGRGTAAARMALQRRLRPDADGGRGRRRRWPHARQREGRALHLVEPDGRQRRPSARVRAALLALLDR